MIELIQKLCYFMSGKMIQRLKALYRLWRSPELDYMADYEMLIRLARRCAYDFSHAADDLGLIISFSGTDKKPFTDWYKTAQYWIKLFSKGNPGKDYRNRLTNRNSELEYALAECMQILKDNNIEIPSSALRAEPIPF